MFKRARWIGAGAALGAGVVLWGQTKLRSLASRYHPVGVAGEAVGRARSIPGTLRDAYSEGRQAMLEAEDELRRSHRRAPGRSRHR